MGEAGTTVVHATQPVTLAHLRRRVAGHIEFEFSRSAQAIDWNRIDELIAECYMKFQRDHLLVVDKTSYNIGPTTIWYNLPDDMLANLLPDKPVEVYPEGTSKAPIFPKWRPWSYMREKYHNFTNPNSNYGPEDWGISNSNQDLSGAEPGQFTVMWPSEDSVTDGLLFNYYPHPGQMPGVIESGDETTTISVTSASSSTFLSAAPSGIQPELDWALGIKTGGTEAEMPTKWYRVKLVDPDDGSGYLVQLTQNYAEDTDGTALYILAPVSTLEWRKPGLIHMAPSLYAAWKYLREVGDLAGAQIYKDEWMSELAGIVGGNRNFQNMDIPGAKHYYRHAAMRIRRYGR